MLRIVILFFLFLPATAVMAADPDKNFAEGPPIHLEADTLSYDRDSGLYHASGNVQLVQGDQEVYSEDLQWNQVTGEINAEGNVRLISPDEELTGNKVLYNLQQKTGLIEDGYFFLRDQNLYVRGESIERLGESEYRIKNGTFTTCDGDVPSWKFGASRVDVTLGGYARARNTVFYLNNIPSLYFPYMLYPAKTDRESGLLIPRVGYSDKRGFQYSGAYYQVLGVNQDATVYLDYLSEMGVGKGLEYRYIFGNDNAGEARGYHIDVDQVDGEVIDEERYALEWQHTGTLPAGVRMVVDSEYVNDDEYFEDFGSVAEEYNKDKVQSVFSLNKSWGKFNLNGQLKYTKDLEEDVDTTLQLLPRISFDANRQKIGSTPFFYAVETEYTHFWRQEGLRGERLMLRPLLSASTQLFKVFNLAPEAAFRQRYYWGLSDESENRDDGLAEYKIRLTMTRLQRIFSLGKDEEKGETKLRHTLEPEVTYTLIPEEDQSYLPYFDTYDRIDEENELEYALVQRLKTRTEQVDGTRSYRDLLYLRTALVHDLRQEASGARFQDLRIETTLLPSDWLSLSSDATLNTDSGDWIKVSFEGTLRDSRENALRASYRRDTEEDIDYARLDLSVAFLAPVYLHYLQRYDFFEEELLEQVIGVEFRRQCWSALLSFQEREDDRSIMLTFTMSGIGSVGGVSGSLGGI